ncbi:MULTISPECIES: hypothetical protein [unclassified Paraburkholderia]|uniref:hypothetical protein n=2 Tax=Paraburkholderia TaxID=1822464 RepID=UPI0038B91CF8
MLPSALIAEPLRHKPGTMNGLQRRVAFTAMHEYDRNRRRYYFYFENAFIFTSSDDSPDILFSLVLHHPDERVLLDDTPAHCVIADRLHEGHVFVRADRRAGLRALVEVLITVEGFELLRIHAPENSSGGRMRLRVLPALLSTGRESASVQHPF